MNWSKEEIYEKALLKLSKKLDKYLQGEWKNSDYKKGGKITYCKLCNNDTIEIMFGDAIYPQLMIFLNPVTKSIQDIVPCNYCKSFTEAYSKKVLNLLGYQLIGKTKKELIEEKIVKNENEIQDLLEKIASHDFFIKNNEELIEKINNESLQLLKELED